MKMREQDQHQNRLLEVFEVGNTGIKKPLGSWTSDDFRAHAQSVRDRYDRIREAS